jgi:MATE family multidrug resistance protein
LLHASIVPHYNLVASIPSIMADLNGTYEMDQERQYLLEDHSEGSIESYDVGEERDTTIKEVTKECVVLAKKGWPLVLANLISNSINIAPVFSLGHLGTQYLAAISLAAMLCNITGYAMGVGMSTALGTLCAQSFTASEDRFLLGKHLQRALFIQLVLALIVGMFWLNTEPILVLLGQEPHIAKLAGTFTYYMLFGLYPYLVTLCIRRYLQGQGIMKAGFHVMLIGSPINVFLQWALVWSPYSNLGAIGAPIASSITNVIICGLMFLKLPKFLAIQTRKENTL